jgi:hypothetical protein
MKEPKVLNRLERRHGAVVFLENLGQFLPLSSHGVVAGLSQRPVGMGLPLSSLSFQHLLDLAVQAQTAAPARSMVFPKHDFSLTMRGNSLLHSETLAANSDRPLMADHVVGDGFGANFCLTMRAGDRPILFLHTLRVASKGVYRQPKLRSTGVPNHGCWVNAQRPSWSKNPRSLRRIKSKSIYIYVMWIRGKG